MASPHFSCWKRHWKRQDSVDSAPWHCENTQHPPRLWTPPGVGMLGARITCSRYSREEGLWVKLPGISWKTGMLENIYPLVNIQKAIWKPWPSRNSGWIPIHSMVIFRSEPLVYQRLSGTANMYKNISIYWWNRYIFSNIPVFHRMNIVYNYGGTTFHHINIV